MKAREKERDLPDNFHELIKSRLYQRVCRELRYAMHILDIGCGTCELDRHLAETNGARVIGVDISDTKFSEKKTRSGGVQCRKGDASQIDFLEEGSMDAVVSIHALHEMKDVLKALREAYRILRCGGRLLIVDFPKGSLAQRLWNEQYYTQPQVAALLQRAGFADVRLITIFRKQLIWARARKACIEQEALVIRGKARKRA